MASYFDTSALVPLLVREPSSGPCDRIFRESDAVVASSLAYVEVHAALAHARRLGRISARDQSIALAAFKDRWQDVIVVHPSDGLLRQAASLADSHGLRGYDAVHCASALTVASDDLIAISGDRALLRAWQDLGAATIAVR